MQIEIRDGILLLGGDITVSTLNDSDLQRFERACADTAVTQIDLSGIGRADSACLALLLIARRRQPPVSFLQLPASVRALAELYEINDWIST